MREDFGADEDEVHHGDAARAVNQFADEFFQSWRRKKAKPRVRSSPEGGGVIDGDDARVDADGHQQADEDDASGGDGADFFAKVAVFGFRGARRVHADAGARRDEAEQYGDESRQEGGDARPRTDCSA